MPKKVEQVEKEKWEQHAIHNFKKLVIFIENETSSDGKEWMPTIAKDLRDYATMIDNRFAGKASPEVFFFDGGNKITVMCGSYILEHYVSNYSKGIDAEPTRIYRECKAAR